MNNQILWLRISYWAGALADGFATLRLLFAEQLPGASADAGYNLGIKWGIALMLGWTFLLIWADRKPLERKAILLLTIFPVIVGLMATSIVTYVAGFATIGTLVTNLVIQTALIVLMGFSYWYARSLDNRTEASSGQQTQALIRRVINIIKETKEKNNECRNRL